MTFVVAASHVITAIAATLVLSSCSAVESQVRRDLHRAPVSYAGTNSRGATETLTFFPDGHYRWRNAEGAGTGTEAHALGRWKLGEGEKRVVLHRADGLRQFEIVGRDQMTPFGGNDGDRAAALLSRLPAVDVIPGPYRLSGTYFYMADAATFTECRSGRRFAVSFEGAHLQLERAFLAARTQRPGSLLATIEGRLVEWTADPGVGAREHLLVDRVVATEPGGRCAPPSTPSRASVGK